MPLHAPTGSKTATPSIDEAPPLPLIVQGRSTALISYLRDRFGDTLSVVLLLAAAFLYLAVQSILAPLYSPLVIKVSLTPQNYVFWLILSLGIPIYSSYRQTHLWLWIGDGRSGKEIDQKAKFFIPPRFVQDQPRAVFESGQEIASALRR